MQIDCLGLPLDQVYEYKPEDLILYKLRYFSISEQDKHVRDIAYIVLAQGEELDSNYIGHWVERVTTLSPKDDRVVTVVGKSS